MNRFTFTVEVRLAWWFVYGYLPALQCVLFLGRLINPEVGVNWERVNYWLNRAIKFKQVK